MQWRDSGQETSIQNQSPPDHVVTSSHVMDWKRNTSSFVESMTTKLGIVETKGNFSVELHNLLIKWSHWVHVTKSKCTVSSSARPMATKIGGGKPPMKPYHPHIRWLHDHIVAWFHEWASLTLSHHTAKFGGNMLCRSGDTTFFVFSLDLTWTCD